MAKKKAKKPDPIVNLGIIFGASGISPDCFTIYIPDQDKNGEEIGTQRKWVLEAISLLSEINGGATAIPVEGAWMNEMERMIAEQPVIVFSYIQDPDNFFRHAPRVRDFMHRLGRETNQGEIAFEFNEAFFRIHNFDVQ